MDKLIRVDPALLRRAAADMARAAQLMLGVGARVGSAVEGASGYDGQLQSEVSAIAGGDARAVNRLAQELESRSEDLQRIAEGFAEADSLEASGRVALAATIRSVVEDGYDTSSIPTWLKTGARPPWMTPKLWSMLPEEDRRDILASLETEWLAYVYGPVRGEYSPGARLDEGFIVHLYLQGVIGTVPVERVWESAAQASGLEFEAYLSEATGIRQPQVHAWLEAAETHGFRQVVVFEEMAGMLWAEQDLEAYFGYDAVGDWTEDDSDGIAGGVLMIAYALAAVTPGGDLPHAAFQQVFGGTVFTLKGSGLDRGWYCSAGGYGWQCEPLAEGHMSAQLLAHELGHTFNARVSNNLSDRILEVQDQVRRDELLIRFPRLTPYSELGRTEIVAEIDGELVHVSGLPDRGGYERTDLGYATLGSPWQQHSIRWDANGNTPNEDFADMFLGWAFDGFSDDAAGAARYDWMDANMPEWIAQASGELDLTWFEPPAP